MIKVYAFRGATYLMTPADAGVFLALRASGRQWERRSWQEAYALSPADWPAFRETVREAVADRPLTREELRAAVGRRRRFRAAAAGLVGGSDTLLKALMWQGDLCFGPVRDGRATVRALAGVPGWTGLPELADAGRRAIAAYLRGYGPAPLDRLHHWLGDGLSTSRRAIGGWLADLADQVTAVTVGGEEALVMTDDVDALAAAEPSPAVRLLPGVDPWVMGPGTADTHVVPPTHRALLSRGANPVVVGGVVAGTWTSRRGVLTVSRFACSEPPDRELLHEEALRLAAVVGTELELRQEVQ